MPGENRDTARQWAFAGPAECCRRPHGLEVAMSCRSAGVHRYRRTDHCAEDLVVESPDIETEDNQIRSRSGAASSSRRVRLVAGAALGV
jgi:hypothetical protein